MVAKLGVGYGPEPTVEAKARAFAGYLEEIGLSVEQVLGNLGPAEVGDVISFFYAGMPDRFRAEVGPDEHLSAHREGGPMPEEHWCAAVWEADEGTPAGRAA